MRLTQIQAETGDLLLDPNNPRYFDLRDHEEVDYRRYAEEQVQLEAIAKLGATARVEDIRRSILSNGLIKFEFIVVKNYEHAEGKFVVIEGNRRLAAIQGIVQDFRLGVLDEKHHATAGELVSIDVLTFEGTDDEEHVIRGIRHVAGPREWRPYQQARLVARLREGENEFEDIQNRLGLGPTQVRRLYFT